jgi:hypothetical protein
MWSPAELERLCQLPWSNPVVSEFEAVFLATPHAQVANPRDLGSWRPGQFVLDAQGSWVEHREQLAKLQVEYKRIGDPGWRG